MLKPEPNMPPSDSEKTYNTKQKRDAFDVATFIVGVFTLGFLIVYTIIN